ncbi:MAG: hypothetical protein ACKPKO_46770, partial [Candidatus Fonsibacter sp.]
MMEMEEMERRENIEKYKDDFIRQSAQNTGQLAQVLRAVHRRQFTPSISSLADSRPDSDCQDIISELGSLEYASNASSLARI